MSEHTIILGDYIAPASRVPISTLEVQVLPDDLLAEWQRCGETADFLASYIAHHFDQPEQVVNVLSTILNELVENAIKFSADKRTMVSLGVSYYGNSVTMTATNPANASQVDEFRVLIDQLLTVDPELLFLARIEATAMIEDDSSGLGLITIRKDYSSGIGVRIRPIPGSELREISVQLHIESAILQSD